MSYDIEHLLMRVGRTLGIGKDYLLAPALDMDCATLCKLRKKTLGLNHRHLVGISHATGWDIPTLRRMAGDKNESHYRPPIRVNGVLTWESDLCSSKSKK